VANVGITAAAHCKAGKAGLCRGTMVAMLSWTWHVAILARPRLEPVGQQMAHGGEKREHLLMHEAGIK